MSWRVLKSSESVVMGTVVGFGLENVKPPFATVGLTVRPIDTFAGSPIGKNVTVSFPIDSLPDDPQKRRAFVDGRPEGIRVSS